ncbi:large subunit ribosomal protein LP1, partial [Lecanoromycetidae sp. Uapishka_2]
MSHSELAVSYASLILADDDLDVTALEGKNVKDMLLNVGSGGGAAAAPAGGATGGAATSGDAPAAEEKKAEKEEEKEESDEDMGFGLFD